MRDPSHLASSTKPRSAPAPFDVDAVAFDLDGTLLDTIHDLSLAVNRLLAELGHAPLPKDTIRDLVGKGMANLVTQVIRGVRGTPPEPDELARLLARYQAIYADVLGHETEAFPGLVEMLAELKARGIHLAVVTNKATRFVRPHLAQAGILDYFDALIGGDDATAKKPDPAPLRLLAERLGIPLRRILMVGDSVNDAQAARAAGCPVVLVPFGYNEGRPVESVDCDGIIDSLAQVSSCVRRAA